MVRLPVAFVEEILEVAQYMDQNDGQLPFSKSSVITSGHFADKLSLEELKEFSAREKNKKLAERIMVGDEEVLISDETFRQQD